MYDFIVLTFFYVSAFTLIKSFKQQFYLKKVNVFNLNILKNKTNIKF